MLKKRFLFIPAELSIGIFFILSLFACSQDPLKDIPEELRKGILRTGERRLPLFENALYERLVKLNVQNQPENIITFQEGKKNSYKILIRPLYNLESRYDVHIKGNPFASLRGAKWSYDKDRRIGKLEWTPGKTFTKSEVYKSVSLPMPVEFKSRGPKEKSSSFAIEKNIEVIVKKILDKPEIYKIATSYQEYEKLEDGLFYTNHGAKALNLQYHDKIFLDRKQERELKYKNTEDLRFYGYKTLSKNSARLRVKYGVDDLYDENGRRIPYHLLIFLKQPLYYPEQEKETGASCAIGSVFESNKNFCLSKGASETKNPPFDTNLYVRQYQIPENLDLNSLFYKVEEKNLCGTYGPAINPNLNIDEEPETPCHLSLSMISSVDQGYFKEEGDIYKYLLSRHLGEKGPDIYKKLKDGSFQLLDKSKWDLSFYKIPDFIKWQISGYQPVKKNIPNIVLTSAFVFNTLDLYVKDYNFFEEAPALVVHKALRDSLFWPFPYLKEWEVNKAKKIHETLWKLSYDLNIDIPRDEDDEAFQYFKANFRVDSKHGVSSDSFTLGFTALPSAKVHYTEIFDKEKDVQFSENFETTNGLKTWISSKLSLSHKIRVRVFPPADFLSQIKTLIFPKDSNLQSYFHPEKTSLDYVDIQRTFTSCLKNEKEALSLAYYCAECSDFTEKTEGYQIYFESLCSYRLNIHADHKTLEEPLQYFSYDYKAPGIPHLRLDNTFYENTLWGEDIPIKVLPENLRLSYQRFKEPRVDYGNRVDVFFNLQPYIKLRSLSEKRKQYTISYPVYTKDMMMELGPSGESAPIAVTFEREKAGGLQARISCGNETGDSPSSHQAGEALSACFCKAPFFSKNSLDVICEFPKNQKDFSVYLETKDPYIYFLNTDPGYSHDYRRTSTVKFNIDSKD